MKPNRVNKKSKKIKKTKGSKGKKKDKDNEKEKDKDKYNIFYIILSEKKNIRKRRASQVPHII